MTGGAPSLTPSYTLRGSLTPSYTLRGSLICISSAMKIHVAEAGRMAAWRLRQGLWRGGVHTCQASTAEAIDQAVRGAVSENPLENVNGCVNVWHCYDRHTASPDPAS